jgi:hypothetical protein
MCARRRWIVEIGESANLEPFDEYRTPQLFLEVNMPGSAAPA